MQPLHNKEHNALSTSLPLRLRSEMIPFCMRSTKFNQLTADYQRHSFVPLAQSTLAHSLWAPEEGLTPSDPPSSKQACPDHPDIRSGHSGRIQGIAVCSARSVRNMKSFPLYIYGLGHCNSYSDESASLRLTCTYSTAFLDQGSCCVMQLSYAKPAMASGTPTLDAGLRTVASEGVSMWVFVGLEFWTGEAPSSRDVGMSTSCLPSLPHRYVCMNLDAASVPQTPSCPGDFLPLPCCLACVYLSIWSFISETCVHMVSLASKRTRVRVAVMVVALSDCRIWHNFVCLLYNLSRPRFVGVRQSILPTQSFLTQEIHSLHSQRGCGGSLAWSSVRMRRVTRLSKENRG
ncbi:unnamed protein product [Protopolystoma xenopodis]|uniref:Uncharacterized protein n=1 Tax=Protopolystoma xenopodis TaxID=117903 RepID=A0A3S5CTD8_9PLAT|nr:unnamed protein product [Protopolystoma xenopodis]